MAKTITGELIDLYVKYGGDKSTLKGDETIAEMLDYIDNLMALPEQKVSIAPECKTATLYGTTVQDMQTGISIAENYILGTLKKLTTGDLPDYWGEGYFLALQFNINDPDITYSDIQVGITNLATLDEDMNCVFFVDKTKKLRVVVTKDGKAFETQYDLSKLNLAE